METFCELSCIEAGCLRAQGLKVYFNFAAPKINEKHIKASLKNTKALIVIMPHYVSAN